VEQVGFIKGKAAAWEPSHPTMVDVASSDARPYTEESDMRG
jgi:hypothetical protein